MNSNTPGGLGPDLTVMAPPLQIEPQVKEENKAIQYCSLGPVFEPLRLGDF